jgi:hypothetical protein
MPTPKAARVRGDELEPGMGQECCASLYSDCVGNGSGQPTDKQYPGQAGPACALYGGEFGQHVPANQNQGPRPYKTSCGTTIWSSASLIICREYVGWNRGALALADGCTKYVDKRRSQGALQQGSGTGWEQGAYVEGGQGKSTNERCRGWAGPSSSSSSKRLDHVQNHEHITTPIFSPTRQRVT